MDLLALVKKLRNAVISEATLDVITTTDPDDPISELQGKLATEYARITDALEEIMYNTEAHREYKNPSLCAGLSTDILCNTKDRGWQFLGQAFYGLQNIQQLLSEAAQAGIMNDLEMAGLCATYLEGGRLEQRVHSVKSAFFEEVGYKEQSIDSIIESINEAKEKVTKLALVAKLAS